MSDRTDEMRRRAEDLDARHDWWLREGQLAFGRMLVRASRFGFMRWLIAGPLSRLISWMMIKTRLMGIEPGRKSDVLDIAENWLKLPTFIRMPYLLVEADDDRVVIDWHQCAVGFEDPACLQACETACNIDIWLVKRLGGRLVVTENMLRGAPKCRFVITRD